MIIAFARLPLGKWEKVAEGRMRALWLVQVEEDYFYPTLLAPLFTPSLLATAITKSLPGICGKPRKFV